MRFFARIQAFVLIFSMVFSNTLMADQWPVGSSRWEYNSGPNPETPEGRALVDLYAELPEYMEMSDAIMEEQKFRYIFGLMMTRTYFDKNAVKILFVGQDATHIAEAAKQPGTSGFGARVQSIGNYFGVDQGVATTNAFLSTIKGQYGSFDHIYIDESSGEPQIRQSAYVDNELWMLSNSRLSEVVIQREAFWEWMIKNNPDAMRLFVVFGGAARDAFAEFLINRGAKVGSKMNPEKLRSIQVPETRLVYAGGNNEFPVPIDSKGKDIYQILLGRKPDYSKPDDQTAAVQALKAAGRKAIDMMVFSGGGVNGSGIVNPAQLGGYDLENVVINGKRTNSLKGLRLSDGTAINHDIAFTMSAHPSSLSKMTPAAASAALKKSFERLEPLAKQGWTVEPDLDENGQPFENSWAAGKDYRYGRADIRAGYFEFGAPDDRRVSRADASRLDPQTIVAGSRDRVKFDRAKIEAAKAAKPAEKKDPADLWSVRPRGKQSRYIFDRGPGHDIAKLLMTSLDRELIFEPKPGMKKVNNRGEDITFETHGIDALYTKTHPGTGFFGLHRGSFQTAKALILADPHGLDDWNTSRALTGARGQYLNGLMRDLGFADDYLVIKTVPVGMDGATADEWEVVRKRTETYREVAIREALKSKKIEIILADGSIAQKEIKRVLAKLNVVNVPVVDINRDGMNPSSGILAAGDAAKKAKPNLRAARISGEMVDISRAHLPWWARTWEGTSGDLVIDAEGPHKGGVRALVTPDWVAKQEVEPSPRVRASINAINAELRGAGLRLGQERITEFVARVRENGRFRARIGTRVPQSVEMPRAAGF